MDNQEHILILDFGSQYSQLIARRIRENHIYSKISAWNTAAKTIAEAAPKGIILSGGPASVCQENAPHCDPAIFRLGIPILGICYGMQLTTLLLGGKVEHSSAREYGKATLHQNGSSALFSDLPEEMQIWMSHGDRVTSLPAGFRKIADSDNTEFAAMEDPDRKIYGIQFHPEVVHTPRGSELLHNFCYKICHCSGNWNMRSFIDSSIAEIRERTGNEKVILGLSGGVDSAVAAALIHRAIGDRLTCIFVNNGLLRQNEAERVREIFGHTFHIQLKYVDAAKLFLQKLAGVDEPEKKRKIIGATFIEVFEHAAADMTDVAFLAQGTTYPDVIESVPIGGNPSAVIKSHHNVGGLPAVMKLRLLEPLSRLFKDEVREVGRQLGLPEELIMRQPFPGPGLGVRVLGEVTEDKLEILRRADAIIVEEMKNADLYYRYWQTFGVFLPIRSVGVMGDERTYDNVIAIRSVESQDGMTAEWGRIPYDLLDRISRRIVNEVQHVNRVVYDVTSKPPSTIEWE